MLTQDSPAISILFYTLLLLLMSILEVKLGRGRSRSPRGRGRGPAASSRQDIGPLESHILDYLMVVDVVRVHTTNQTWKGCCETSAVWTEIAKMQEIRRNRPEWFLRLNFRACTTGNRCDIIDRPGTCRHLRELPSLTSLSICGHHCIGVEGYQNLKELRQLTSLSIGDDTHMAAWGCQHLKELGQLTSLSLGADNAIDALGCQRLKELRQLRSLSFGARNDISELGCQHLRELD
jgi:hypothetical protein